MIARLNPKARKQLFFSPEDSPVKKNPEKNKSAGKSKPPTIQNK